MRINSTNQRGNVAVAEQFDMPTLEDVSGQVPAVIDADYRVIPDDQRQIPVFIEPKTRPTQKVDVNAATDGKSIPEALAYHLACIETLSRAGNATGNVQGNTWNPPVQTSASNPPRNQGQGDSFTRIRNAFD